MPASKYIDPGSIEIGQLLQKLAAHYSASSDIRAKIVEETIRRAANRADVFSVLPVDQALSVLVHQAARETFVSVNKSTETTVNIVGG